jgi:very-short-patch-repair endonuclease
MRLNLKRSARSLRSSLVIAFRYRRIELISLQFHLRLAHSRMFVCRFHLRTSRHLYIIPKTPEQPTPVVPTTRKSFLRSFGKDPVQFSSIAESFVSQMDPSELVGVIYVMSRSVTPALKPLHELVIKRSSELIDNFTLSEVVVLYKYLRLRKKNSHLAKSWLERNMNPEAVQKLSTFDLIYLIHMNADAVAHELSRRRDLNAYQLSTIVNEYKKIHVYPERLFDYIQRSVKKLPETALSSRDIALLANAFCEYHKTSETLKALSDSAVSKMDSFTVQGLGLLLHALVKADLVTENSHVFTAAADRLIHLLPGPGCESQSVALVMYCFGKSEVKNAKFVSHMGELVKRNLQLFDFRALASVCYGFSRLRYVEDRDLWRLLADEVVFRGTEKRNSRVTKRVTDTDVAMIAKAFSRLPKALSANADAKLSFVLYQLLKRKSEEGALQSSTVVAIMDAFTRLNQYRESVQGWVNKHLIPLLDKLTPTELVSVIASVSKLGIKNKVLSDKLIADADKIADPILRISAAVRLAKMQVYDSVFARNSIKVISANLGSLDFDSLLNALFAFSEMNHRDIVFNSRIIQAIRHQLRSLGSLSSKQLSTLIVATSRLRIVDETFYDDIMTKVFENASMFESERCICNTLFAMSSALGSGDWKNSSAWFTPVAIALIERLPDYITVEGVRQLQIFSLALKLMDISLDDGLSERRLSKLETINTFTCNIPSIEQSSAVHREISRLVTLLGLEHRNEATIGPYSLDIFVPKFNVVIEIDGPHHFFRDDTLRTSSSVLKHSILKNLGYAVIHIPFQEWLQCSSDAKKMAYCSELVDRIRSYLINPSREPVL